MPASDADFAAYVGARWHHLVRTLVLIGCSQREAEDAAQTGLARCYASWDRVRRADDVDVSVYRTVLDRWHKNRKHQDAAVTEDVAVDDASEQVVLRQALEAELARLSPEHREVLVLRFVAELTDAQVAEVLDVALDTVRGRVAEALSGLDLAALPQVRGRMPVEQVFREASESIEVLSPPYDEVVIEARDSSRQHRRRVTAAAVAAIVVVGGTTWLATRPPPAEPPLPPAIVTAATNLADVAWYDGSLLHLDDVTVELPQLTDLAEVTTGAVYGDTTGTVSFVTADGSRRLLGHKDPGEPLAVSASDGWVAWVDPTGEIPRLVVDDVYAGGTVGELDLPDGGRPIAIDQARVFYSTPDGEYSWAADAQDPERQVDVGLVDIEAATRVYQRVQSIELVQPFFNVTYRVPGHGARLSFGGGFVLSAKPSDRPDGDAFDPFLYDVRSGGRLPSGIHPEELAVDAAFGGQHTVAYLVAQRADLESTADPLLVLRSCELGTRHCVDLAPVPTTDGTPLLAH